MNKQTTRNILLLIAIATALIFVTNSTSMMKVMGAGLTGGGFNVLSVDQIDYMSNVDRFTGSVIQVTATLTGDEYIRAGTINKEDIEAYTDKFAESDIKISSKVTEETCNYNIQNEQTPIYKYNEQVKQPNELNFPSGRDDLWWRDISYPIVYIKGEEDYQHLSDTVNEMTPNTNIDNIEAYIEKAKWNYYLEAPAYWEGWVVEEAYIVKKNQVAVKGSVQKPSQPLTWKSQIQVTNPNGETEQLTLNSDKTSALTDKVYIEHLKGTLDNGNCPDVYDHDIGAVYQNKQWKITSRQAISDYNSLEQTQPENTLVNQYYDVWSKYYQGCTGGCTSPSDSDVPFPDVDNSLNNLATKSTEPISIGTVKNNSVNNIKASGTKQGGNLQLEMNRFIAIPIVKIMIDANWAGVYKPVSKPEITLQNPEKQAKSGEYFTQTATIENTGEVEDQFTISTTCDGPIAPTQRSPFYVTLSPGQTTTRTLSYIGNTPEDTSTTCTVKATSEQYEDTAQFNVNLETIPNPEPECGNGKCEYTENYTNCPTDCKKPEPGCESGETRKCTKNGEQGYEKCVNEEWTGKCIIDEEEGIGLLTKIGIALLILFPLLIIGYRYGYGEFPWQ